MNPEQKAAVEVAEHLHSIEEFQRDVEPAIIAARNEFLTQETIVGWSSPVEWCNRFVSFGVGYALSWSGGSSCPVGWGVSRDLVRMSRLR